MKKEKKLAALLVCACMALTALTGCSGKDEGADANGAAGGKAGDEKDDASGGEPSENAKGRFLETELALPEKISKVIGVRKCADDAVVLVGYDENQTGVYIERSGNRGEDWEEVEADADGDYILAAIGDDGQAALVGYSDSMTLVSADGSGKELKLALPDYEGDSQDPSNFVVAAAYAADRLFVVDLNHRLYEVDADSGELNNVSQQMESDITGIMPLGKQLALLTRNGVRLMDASDGTLLEEDTELENAIGVLENNTDTPIYPVMLTEGENPEDIYFVSHDGIFYHKQGGSTIEQLANGELMSVGDSSLSFRAFVRFDEEHFLVFGVDAFGTEHCYSYAYDAEVSAVPEKQLNVYALEDSTVLQQAINLFRRSNQDVFVKKTIGMTGDDGVTAEDAIKTLNTEILAGNGPDVLVLDGLPTDSYVEKGILADISGLVDETDGLFTNITDAYKRDGAIYQVPLRFYCSLAEKDEGIGELSGAPEKQAASVQTLKGGDAPVFAPLPAEMFLYAFYNVYSPTWKTESGIDAEALKRSLEALKTMYDIDGYEEKERRPYSDIYDIYQNQIVSGTVNAGSISRLLKMAQISIGTVGGVQQIQDLYGMESVKAGSFELLCTDDGKKTFVPMVSLGLAKSAADNDLAQEFIRLALSEDGQSQMSDAFSVNRKAYENECDNGKAYSIGMSDPDGNQSGYEVKPLDASQKDALTAMLESLEVPVWNDRVVTDLVISEGRKYLLGEQSLEDTVGAITQKVQLYVSE